eukprot:TRINITY_DN3937_c0_g1_i1.p1 TRINITY_DN3937_c0_g1~~TRINITY_DN3937_c0_g1_i1.p1  ORF type:complete len:1187 (+),score=216.71 TRINITY_DN3937_c0_g1_i1:75-3635(+)
MVHQQRHDYRQETRDVIAKISSKIKDKNGTGRDAKEILGSLSTESDDFPAMRVVGFYIKVIDTVGKDRPTIMRYSIEGLTRLVEAGLIHSKMQLDAPGTVAGCGKSIDEAVIESVTRHTTKNQEIQLLTIKVLELLVTSSYSNKVPTTSTILQVVYQHLFRSYLGSQYLNVRREAKGAFQRCSLSLLHHIEDCSFVIRHDAMMITTYAAIAVVAASELLRGAEGEEKSSGDHSESESLGENQATIPQGNFDMSKLIPRSKADASEPPAVDCAPRPSLDVLSGKQPASVSSGPQHVDPSVSSPGQDSPLNASLPIALTAQGSTGSVTGLIFSPPVGSCAAPIASTVPFTIPSTETADPQLTTIPVDDTVSAEEASAAAAKAGGTAVSVSSNGIIDTPLIPSEGGQFTSPVEQLLSVKTLGNQSAGSNPPEGAAAMAVDSSVGTSQSCTPLDTPLFPGGDRMHELTTTKVEAQGLHINKVPGGGIVEALETPIEDEPTDEPKSVVTESDDEVEPDSPKIVMLTEKDLIHQLHDRNVCEHDLFRVITTLCNQAVKDISKETEHNDVNVQTRVHALQCLVAIFNSADEGTMGSGLLVTVLKSRLLNVLIANIATTRPKSLFTEAVQLLLLLYRKCFRNMRAELTSVTVYLLLPIARSGLCSFLQLVTIINFLSRLVSLPRQFIHIFANVDCCPDCDDLVTSIALTLSFIATHCYARYEWITRQQSLLIQHRACNCLCLMIHSCIQWGSSGTHQRSKVLLAPDNPSVDFFRARVVKKIKEVELHTMWLEKNKKARKMVVDCKFATMKPDSFAKWLQKDALRLYLNPRGTAKILTGRDDWCVDVLNSYIRSMDFEDLSLFEAIVKFFSYFHPEGESAVLCRIGIYFAARYGMCNPHLLTVDATQHDLAKGQIVCFRELGDHNAPVLYMVHDDSPKTDPFVDTQICSEESLKAISPEEPVQRFSKAGLISLDVTYITLMTILQASSEIHIKKKQQRGKDDWIKMVQGATSGLLSEEAISMIFSNINQKSITPDVNSSAYSNFRFTNPLTSSMYLNTLEMLSNVEQQIQADQLREREKKNLAARSKQHKRLRQANEKYRQKTKEYLSQKPEWRKLDEQVELLGHDILSKSELPIDKAIAKAFSMGVGKLKDNALNVKQPGLFKSKYFPELTSKDLSVVLFEVCILCTRLLVASV